MNARLTAPDTPHRPDPAATALAGRRVCRRAATAALVAAAWLVGAAHAAGLVRYEIKDPESGQRGHMTYEWLSPQQVRIEASVADMPVGTQAYQLMRDGKLYNVTVQDGQTVVMELGRMLRLMGRLASALPSSADDDVHELKDLRATGRSETVAGLRGEVYELVYLDDQGRTRREEIVLSNDPLAYELSQAMQAYARLIVEAMDKTVPQGRDQFAGRLRDQRVGMLRMGEFMRAVEVSRTAPAAARLALPAEPMALPDLSGLAGALRGAQREAAGDAARESAEGAAAREARRQAERQQQRVGDQAREETDRAADRTVDRALNRLRERLGR
jgi:hypothetical protein